jgi:hypothetical protein
LFPDYKKLVDEVMVKKEKEIRDAAKKSGNSNDAMRQFKSQADMFRSLDVMRN